MLPTQRCLIMNKLISANYWFGCDWCFCEVGYLGLHGGQLSLTCVVVYLWNTGYIRVTCPRRKPGIQHLSGKGASMPSVGVAMANYWAWRSGPYGRRTDLTYFTEWRLSNCTHVCQHRIDTAYVGLCNIDLDTLQ